MPNALLLVLLLVVPAVAATPSPADDERRINAALAELARTLAAREAPLDRLFAAELLSFELRREQYRERQGEALSMTLTKRLDRQREVDALLASIWAAPEREELVLVKLLVDCPGSRAACRPADALAELRERAPGNAVVWLIDAEPRAPTEWATITAEALSRAAEAVTWDDYYTRAGRARLERFEALPVDLALVAAVGRAFGVDTAQAYAALDASHARNLLGLNLALMAALPATGAFSQACGRREVDPAFVADCLVIARSALREADTIMSLRTAEQVIWRRSTDAAERARIFERRRVHRWLLDADFDAAAAAPFNGLDPAYIADWRAHGEMHAIAQRLERAGLPSTPPPDWMPSRDQLMLD